MVPINAWTILVIEDEKDSMELVQGVLEYHGIYTIGVATAEDALEILKSSTPTLIICDLQLPGLHGWGFLKALRANRDLPRVPCVAITAFHTPELAEQSIAAGFDAYFAKPLDATSFLRELQSIVTR